MLKTSIICIIAVISLVSSCTYVVEEESYTVVQEEDLSLFELMCDDGNPCTEDYYNKRTYQCNYKPNKPGTDCKFTSDMYFGHNIVGQCDEYKQCVFEDVCDTTSDCYGHDLCISGFCVDADITCKHVDDIFVCCDHDTDVCQDVEDMDRDRIVDIFDNCTGVFNPEQFDENDNGIGDLCDPDTNLEELSCEDDNPGYVCVAGVWQHCDPGSIDQGNINVGCSESFPICELVLFDVEDWGWFSEYQCLSN
jgi:hypothetical protein